MKRWRNLALYLPFLLVFVGIYISSQKNLTCQVYYREDVVIKISTNVIRAEEATTPAQRAKGLGGRNCISDDQGMLFEFEKPDYYSFWMKDMKFPIDIIWINKNHQVVTIKPNLSPSTYPQTFINDFPAQYVLELKAGQSLKLGIDQGTKISF